MESIRRRRRQYLWTFNCLYMQPNDPPVSTSPAFTLSRAWRGGKALAGLLLLGIGLAAPLSSRALPPANDRCAGAEAIPPDGPFPYWTQLIDITDATTLGDPPSPSCPSFPDTPSRSVWYLFTPQVAASYTISTCSDAPTWTTVADTVMGIYTSRTGCAASSNFVEVPVVGCADDTCGSGLQAALTTYLQADTTYYIVVWQYGPDAPWPGEGNLQLLVTRWLPPANDVCSMLGEVMLNIPVIGTTIGAANDYQLSAESCFTGIGQSSSVAAGPDVVYGFTAPEAGNYSFKVMNYIADNLVLYVASSCPLSGSPAIITNCLGAANRSRASTSEEIVGVPLAAQQRVFIYVDVDLDSESPTIGSTFKLEVTRCVQEAEPNHTPATATPIACPITGSIDPAGDVDFYALGSYPPNWRVFAFLDGEGANLPDFDLRVTSATNTLEYDDNNNAALFGENSPNVAGTPLPGGPAFLRVNYNGLSTVAEPYRLYAVVQPPLAYATREQEPNNTLADADARWAASPATNNYLYGTCGGPRPSDVDVYRFPANAGELIFLSLDADPLRDNTPIDPKLELLDEAGNVLVVVDDVDAMSSTNAGTGTLAASFPYSPGESLVYRCLVDGTYYARVSIASQVTGSSATGDYLLSISKNGLTGSPELNTPPAVTNLTVATPIFENDTATLTGRVVDPDPGNLFRVAVDWGDGSPVTTNSLPFGTNTFSVTHQYLDDQPGGTAADTYRITVTAYDNSGGSGSAGTNVTVRNVAPSGLSLSLGANPINENTTVALNGSFADPGTLDTYTVVVKWGDGSTNTFALPAGILSFSTNHLYRDNPPPPAPSGNYPIQVIVTDDDTGSVTNNTSVQVNNLPPAFGTVTLNSPIAPYGTANLSGTFADPSPLDTLTLTVNWGDGSPAQTNSYAAGATTFNLAHQYTLANTNLTVILTLRDDDTGTATTNQALTIQGPPAAARFKSITQVSTNRFLLRLEGAPGATYRIEASPSLTNWTNFGSQTADTNGLFQIEDSTVPKPQKRFYRAVWP